MTNTNIPENWTLHSDIVEIKTSIEHLTMFVKDKMAVLTKNVEDHEQRVRKLEEACARKSDMLKLHDRIDKLQTRVWYLISALLASGALGGTALKFLF